MASSPISSRILQQVEHAKTRGVDPLVVMDLDGTLYNNAVRTLRILQEFAHLHATDYPDITAAVDGLASGDMAYKVEETLRRVGVQDQAVLRHVERFWGERFFTNAYVVYDLPAAGAVQFVERVHQAGAVPVYLTGRDAPNMLLGTLTALQRDGFPVGTVDTRIILKDDFKTPDARYKSSVVEHLRRIGEVVAVFDNEPGLCNLFHEAFPDALVVWLRTSWAPDPPPLADGIAELRDFSTLL